MKKKKKTAQLPFRLNVLFFVVFLMFLILVLQLGVVQILKGDTFQEEIDRTEKDITKEPVPRGKIFDKNNQVIADNEPMYAITYTPPKDVQPKENLDLAKDLADYISMDIEDISLRDKQDYWYLHNEDDAEDRLSEEEREDMDTGEQYTEVLERITDEELNELTDEDLEIIAIKSELDKAQSLTPQIIKNEDVTLEEYSHVGEHLDQLPGINVTTDWDRLYPNENSFNAFLGSITSQDQGILADQEQFYLTRGYSRNDRVGRSGLEKQYEDVLRGRKEQIEYITNKNGAVVDSDVLVPGKRGKDLVLTIDQEYQEKVDDIVEEQLEKTIKEDPGAHKYLEDALAVVMNPKTGEILAMSGKHYNHDKKEVEDAALKTIHDIHLPGSSIKGATVLAGLDSGVISPNEVIHDKPIQIAGGDPKSSWINLGPVNDIDAIGRSSNVYMWHIAMRISGNPVYKEKQNIIYKDGSFQKMQNYFRQFGLGTETGIDYPNEALTNQGDPEARPYVSGLLQDFSIGQFEAYTTLQMAQYVSTIANDGYRVRPHLIKEIREPSLNKDELGPIYRKTNTDVLNKIEMDQSYLERVQEGFRRAYQDPQGTAGSYFSDKDYNPAGKTGTAENSVHEDGEKIDTENLALVGYAPFDDPEVAFAVIVPNTGSVSDRNPINNYIGEGILDTYFELKEKRDND